MGIFNNTTISFGYSSDETTNHRKKSRFGNSLDYAKSSRTSDNSSSIKLSYNSNYKTDDNCSYNYDDGCSYSSLPKEYDRFEKGIFSTFDSLQKPDQSDVLFEAKIKFRDGVLEISIKLKDDLDKIDEDCNSCCSCSDDEDEENNKYSSGTSMNVNMGDYEIEMNFSENENDQRIVEEQIIQSKFARVQSAQNQVNNLFVELNTNVNSSPSIDPVFSERKTIRSSNFTNSNNMINSNNTIYNNNITNSNNTINSNNIVYNNNITNSNNIINSNNTINSDIINEQAFVNNLNVQIGDFNTLVTGNVSGGTVTGAVSGGAVTGDVSGGVVAGAISGGTVSGGGSESE